VSTSKTGSKGRTCRKKGTDQTPSKAPRVNTLVSMAGARYLRELRILTNYL